MSKIIVGDCFKILPTLQNESVDLTFTSPPYWGLRSYGGDCIQIFGGEEDCEHDWDEVTESTEGYASKTRWQHGENGRHEKALLRRDDPEAWMKDVRKYSWCRKCGAWRGELGLEPHPQMFVDHIVDFARLVRQVLKPSGLLWLNLGDTYCTLSGSSRSPGGDVIRGPESVQPASSPNRTVKADGGWIQEKQLMLMPSRVAIALQNDGWILRSDVVWAKPNHMPESIKDRFSKSYEHLFMFAKQPRYFFNLDAVRERYAESKIQRITQPSLMGQKGGEKQEALHGGDAGNGNRPADILKGLGEKYGGKYAGLRDGEALGSPRASILRGRNESKLGLYRDTRKNEGLPEGNIIGKNPGDVWTIPTQPFPGSHFAVFPEELVRRIIKCSCPEKGIVLDPFAGSGTTLRVARKLGRRYIGIELNPGYAAMAEQRIRGKNFRVKDDAEPLQSFCETSKEASV
jgi:DNA modification methylase